MGNEFWKLLVVLIITIGFLALCGVFRGNNKIVIYEKNVPEYSIVLIPGTGFIELPL